MLKIKRKLLTIHWGPNPEVSQKQPSERILIKKMIWNCFKIFEKTSHFLVGGSKIMSMIKEFKNGETDHMMPTSRKMFPVD